MPERPRASLGVPFSIPERPQSMPWSKSRHPGRPDRHGDRVRETERQGDRETQTETETETKTETETETKRLGGCEACGFEVRANRHSGGGGTTGKHFYFYDNGATWSTPQNVQQFRAGSLIWSGPVDKWHTPGYMQDTDCDSVASCTTCSDFVGDSSGRRDAGASSGQWEIGDIVHIDGVHPSCSVQPRERAPIHLKNLYAALTAANSEQQGGLGLSHDDTPLLNPSSSFKNLE